jgi:hypothetical protein
MWILPIHLPRDFLLIYGLRLIDLDESINRFNTTINYLCITQLSVGGLHHNLCFHANQVTE